MTASQTVNPMQAQYEAALERAQLENLCIFHADPKVGEYFVQNPAHAGYYVVELVDQPQPHFTCNCEAGQRQAYCKHRAWVRAAIIAKAELPRLTGGALAVTLARVERGMPAHESEPEPTPPAPAPAPATQPSLGWDVSIEYACRDCKNAYGADDVVMLNRNLLNPIVVCKACAATRHAAELAEKEARKAAKAGNAPAPAPAPVPAPWARPSDGTYTIVHSDGTHRTLKVHTPRDGGLAGKHIAKYLCGSDNDSDYAGFAFFAEDGGVHMWKRFASNMDLLADARILAQPNAAQAAGLAYALESGNCYRCGHTLTVPASIHRGLGPDCAAKVGC